MRCRWYLFSLTFLTTSPALAGDQLVFGPPPSWIVVQPVPAAPPVDDAPVSLLLFDSQAKLEADQSIAYTHSAMRLNTAQGLSAGNVAALWDPAFDTVTVHKLTIRRGSQTIDVLGSGQKFTIIRREPNLEQQTLNGQLTATLLPEGLQVGDIIESQMSIAHRDPTLKGHMEMGGTWDLPMRIERAHMRILTPSGRAVRERLVGGMSAASLSKKDEHRIATWVLAPMTPETGPSFAPARFTTGRGVEISDYRSWDDLAAVFMPLFRTASAIPGNSPLQQEVARIKASSTDPIRQAALALQLVQDKVRYVNLALGVGGLVPASADVTWQRRFGDCKAKTALLIGLLRELGIESVPVLVSTENGDGMNDRLPMVAHFNHVLVRARVAGRDYWLDGTRTGDTSLATLEIPFYRWGLPVLSGASLVRIQPPPLDKPSFEKIIRTDASAGAAKAVPTTLELVSRGDSAVAQNILLSALDASVRDQALRKALEDTLDRFEVDKFSAAFDAEKREFRIRGEGRQTLDIDRGVYWSEVPTPGYKADFRRTGTRNADAPVELSYPSYARTVQTILMPKDRLALVSTTSGAISETVAGTEYRQSLKKTDNSVVIESSSRTLFPEIAYAEAVAAEPRLRAMDKEDIGFRISASAPVEAAAVKELIGRDAKTAADFFQAANKFMNEGRLSEALGVLDRAVGMDQGNSNYRSMRAQVRMFSGDSDGAESDALLVVKSEPKSIAMRSLLTALYWKKDRPDAALAQVRALESADSATAQVTRGRLLSSIGRPDEALAAFDRALTFDKDPMTHVLRAMVMPVGDKQRRSAELEAAIKLNPSDATTLDALADLASQVGDHNRALQLLDQAFLKSPDDINIRHSRAVQMSLAGKTDAANKEFDAIAKRDLTRVEWNNICWDKAMNNVALDRAMTECEKALADGEFLGARDSKGVVLLRQSKFDLAIAEFDAVLAQNDLPASFYARGLAYARKGDKAKAEADFAKAEKMEPGITRRYDYAGLRR